MHGNDAVSQALKRLARADAEPILDAKASSQALATDAVLVLQ